MDEHQRSAPFWDFMWHMFKDNVLIPIFKGQADCLIFEDGMSRNVGKKLSCIKSRKSTDLIYTMTEAWNHTNEHLLRHKNILVGLLLAVMWDGVPCYSCLKWKSPNSHWWQSSMEQKYFLEFFKFCKFLHWIIGLLYKI